MTAETLRALSRTYAAGELDRESYRLERRRLLEAVAEGSTPVVEFTAPEPEAPTVFPYDDDDGDTTQEIIPTVSGGETGASVEKKQQRLFALIALALLIAGVAAGLMLRGDGDPALPTVPAPQVVTAPVPPPSLFDDFLGANTWSESSMNALRGEWDALDEAARSELRQSTSLVRLTDAIVDQINSQSALVDLGQPEIPLETQGRLLDLAEHLGLQDARLDEARAGWVAATAALTAAGAAPFEPAVPQAEPATDEPATPAALAAPAAEAPAEPPAPAPPAQPKAAPQAPQPVAEPAAARSDAPPAAADITPTPVPVPAAPVAGERDAKSAPAKAASRSNCAAELARTRRPYCIDLLPSGQKGPVLVVLPAGSFTMGGTKAEEQPRHEVTIDYPLAIGMFEVSVAELEAFCRASGQTCPQQPWQDPKLPAVNVALALASAYAAWLSDITGATYRLPSEAEWEYAARGGRQSPYPFGDGVLPTDARFSYGNAETRPTAANDRSLNRNDFRLYHIAGNVRELTRDGWRDTYAGAPADGSAAAANGSIVAVRGGSYADGSDQLRSAARVRLDAATGDPYTGFRVVRLLAE